MILQTKLLIGDNMLSMRKTENTTLAESIELCYHTLASSYEILHMDQKLISVFGRHPVSLPESYDHKY